MQCVSVSKQTGPPTVLSDKACFLPSGQSLCGRTCAVQRVVTDGEDQGCGKNPEGRTAGKKKTRRLCQKRWKFEALSANPAEDGGRRRAPNRSLACGSCGVHMEPAVLRSQVPACQQRTVASLYLPNPSVLLLSISSCPLLVLAFPPIWCLFFPPKTENMAVRSP